MTSTPQQTRMAESVVLKQACPAGSCRLTFGARKTVILRVPPALSSQFLALTRSTEMSVLPAPVPRQARLQFHAEFMVLLA